MAMDRLWLVCSCGEKILFCKYYLGVLPDINDNICEWLRIHIVHHPRYGLVDFGGKPGFTLAVESAGPPPQDSLPQ